MNGEIIRYNNWREWKPIIAKCSIDEYYNIDRRAKSLGNPEAQAVFYYCSFTGYNGIEFVLLSGFVDKTAIQCFSGEVFISPCNNVLYADSPESMAPPMTSAYYIYDGWMPIENLEKEVILAALKKLEDYVMMIGHAYRSSTRLIVKYIEYTQDLRGYQQIDEGNRKFIDITLTRLNSLPDEIQSAILRSIVWFQNSIHQRRPTDRFLALWTAYESLLLAVYENQDSLDLKLEGTGKGLSKKERHLWVQQSVRDLILKNLEQDPIKAVEKAYFEGIVGIRKRIEIVLSALLGSSDPRVQWSYGYNKPNSPSNLRSDIVHWGLSNIELHVKYPIRSYCITLEVIIIEIIERLLRGCLNGAEMEKREIKSMIYLMQNIIPCAPEGGWEFKGNFEITPQLLWSKGLL